MNMMKYLFGEPDFTDFTDTTLIMHFSFLVFVMSLVLHPYSPDSLD